MSKIKANKPLKKKITKSQQLRTEDAIINVTVKGYNGIGSILKYLDHTELAKELNQKINTDYSIIGFYPNIAIEINNNKTPSLNIIIVNCNTTQISKDIEFNKKLKDIAMKDKLINDRVDKLYKTTLVSGFSVGLSNQMTVKPNADLSKMNKIKNEN